MTNESRGRRLLPIHAAGIASLILRYELISTIEPSQVISTLILGECEIAWLLSNNHSHIYTRTRFTKNTHSAIDPHIAAHPSNRLIVRPSIHLSIISVIRFSTEERALLVSFLRGAEKTSGCWQRSASSRRQRS